MPLSLLLLLLLPLMVVPLSGHLVFITVSIQSSLETKHCGSVPTVADPEDRARGAGRRAGDRAPAGGPVKVRSPTPEAGVLMHSV